MFYLSLFALCTIIIYIAEKVEKRSSILFWALSFVSIFILSFIAGCRDNTIGTDIHVYGEWIFKNARTSEGFFTNWDPNYGKEVGYYTINRIAAIFSDKIGFSLFLQMFIELSAVFYAFYLHRDKVSIWLSMLIFMLYYYNLTLNMMRQGVATPFYAISCYYLWKGNDKKSYLFAIIAFLLHKSSIVAYGFSFLLIKGVNEKKPSRSTFVTICCVIGCFLAFELLMMIISLIPSFGYFYAYVEGFKSFVSTGDILLRLPLWLILFLGLEVRKTNPRLFYLTTNLVIISTAIVFFGKYTFFFTRFAYYFTLLAIMFSLQVLKETNMSRGTRYIVTSCFIAIFAIYTIKFNFMDGLNETYPYSSEVLGITS